MFVIYVIAVIISAILIFASVSPRFKSWLLDTLKWLLVCTITVSVFIGAFIFLPPAHAESVYARTAIVIELDRANDIVAVEDGAGLVWEFDEVEDYELGDFVSLLMSDAGTPDNIYDDKIIDVTYAGFNMFCM